MRCVVPMQARAQDVKKSRRRLKAKGAKQATEFPRDHPALGCSRRCIVPTASGQKHRGQAGRLPLSCKPRPPRRALDRGRGHRKGYVTRRFKLIMRKTNPSTSRWGASTMKTRQSAHGADEVQTGELPRRKTDIVRYEGCV